MTTINDIKKKIELKELLLILSVAAVIAGVYVRQVEKPFLDERLELHNQIIRGTALSPYRYRVLVPFTAEVFTRALLVILPQKAAFHLCYAIYDADESPTPITHIEDSDVKAAFFISYAIYDLMAIFFLLASLFLWLRTWFNREQALIGVLFIAGTMPITLQDNQFQGWSLLEAGIFSGALFAIHRKRYWLLVFLAAVGSLNRETAFLYLFCSC